MPLPSPPAGRRPRHALHRIAMLLVALLAPAGAKAGATEVAFAALPGEWSNVGTTFGHYPHAPTLAADANRLYVPLGYFSDALAVFDVSDPLQPTVQLAPGLPARSVAALGNLVYAIDGNRLRIANLADPTAPVLLRELALNSSTTGVAANAIRVVRRFERTWAFVTGDGDFPALRAIDVTDAAVAAPAGAGSAERGGADLAVVGRHAFVASFGAGLRCYDVADPAHPILIGDAGTLGVATAIAVRGGIAYVLNGGLSNSPWRASLVTLDVRDPARPRVIGVATIAPEVQQQIGSLAPYAALQLRGDSLYAGSGSGLLAFDVADPAAPRLLERLGPDALSAGARAVGDRLLVVSTDGLRVLEATPEVTFPPVCAEAGSDAACLALDEDARLSLPLFRSYDPSALFLDGVHPAELATGVFWVPMGPSGLVAVDVGGDTPDLVGHFPALASHHVAIEGDRLYGLDWSQLWIADLSDRTRPRKLGSIGGLGDRAGDAIAVRNALAYVVGAGPAWDPSAFRIYDLSGPAQPALLGELAGVLGADVAITGDHAYVAAFDRGLRILDVSQPAAVAPLGETGTVGSAVRVVLDLPYAYVLNAADVLSLAVVDVGDPAAPILADLLPITGGVRASYPLRVGAESLLDMTLSGDTLVIGTASGAVAVDVTDPGAVRQIGASGPALFARALAIAGERVAIATDAGVSFAPLELAGVCDADGDASIDWNDVGAITDANGEPAATPTDPRDADRDAQITVSDAARCVEACAATSCVPDPDTPACTAPGEIGRFDVAWFGMLSNPGSVAGVYPRPPVVIGDLLFEPTGGVPGPGLVSFDLSDPAAPRALGALAMLGSHALARAGDLLVGVGSTRLTIIDPADGVRPNVLGSLDLPFGASARVGLEGAPDRAYLASYDFNATSPALRIFDLSDPARPALIGSSTERIGYDVAVSDGHAFVARGDLTVFDLANEVHPVSVASLDLDAYEVALAGELAIVLSWTGGSFGRPSIVAVDVSDPAAPVERSRVAIPNDLMAAGLPLRRGPVAGLEIAGDRAFLAGPRGGIAIDLSDPGAVAALGVVGDDVLTGGVAAHGGRLAVVNGHGVQVLAGDVIPSPAPGCPRRPRRCGLLGAEPALLLPWLGWLRTRRRHTSSVQTS